MRRAMSVLIAISLFLPLQSCTGHDDSVSDVYPLSGDFDGMLAVAAIYLLPLLAFVRTKLKLLASLVGISACSAGLYVISYAATQWANQLLVGWYTYTVAAACYLFLSIIDLRRMYVANKRLELTGPIN
ncbi:MAG TPA: hypothetical protein VJA19_05200 [Pseudomonas sp.]|nr:hypothetical protein [Pseudomonas sp.]